MITSNLKLGIHRGAPRLWIEGKRLTNAGFNAGDRYNITQTGESLIITKSPSGTNKVAGTLSRPIIDRHSQDWSVFGGRVQVEFTPNKLIITKG